MGPGPEGEEMAAHEDETRRSQAAGARPVAHIDQGSLRPVAGLPGEPRLPETSSGPRE